MTQPSNKKKNLLEVFIAVHPSDLKWGLTGEFLSVDMEYGFGFGDDV